MAWLHGVPAPKGETRKRIEGRRRRTAAKVVRSVRSQCVDRDGFCRLMGVGPCAGASELAHLGDKKRFKTRGQAPEVRHTTAGSFMACAGHHRRYDAGEIQIEAMTANGADGSLCVRDLTMVAYV
jgi:hypothetical protein